MSKQVLNLCNEPFYWVVDLNHKNYDELHTGYQLWRSKQQYRLFCTEIDVFWLEQKVSELLMEMHMHVESSSSLIMRLSLRLDYPELGIYTMGVCNWIESQTNPHWENWAFEKWNSPQNDPKTILSWEVCPISKVSLPIFCLEFDKFCYWYPVPGTNGEFPITPCKGWGNVFLLICWHMRPLLYCRSKSWHKSGVCILWLSSMQNKWRLFPEYLYGAGVGLPTSDYEKIVSSARDELPIHNNWHF